MTKEQCSKCGRKSYRNGKCYADNAQLGKPISIISYCGWTNPPEALKYNIIKKKNNDTSRRSGK